jgi:hypothetical protein
MGGGYLDYFVKWMAGVASAVGQWLADVAHKLTHDPLWAGIAIALVVVLVVLFFLKRRASGGK